MMDTISGKTLGLATISQDLHTVQITAEEVPSSVGKGLKESLEFLTARDLSTSVIIKFK
ncbi:hypothetical protein [Synechococcus sp. M16CYN]|uniref:hypothetical protein n=1 Tax=Synechococcus sp. M16CYN TaxID=3103139 RepID=UPI00333F5993